MKNKAAQQLGRLGGKVTSEAKAAAVRANGAKGGRPRSSRKAACDEARRRITGPVDRGFGHYGLEVDGVAAPGEGGTYSEMQWRIRLRRIDMARTILGQPSIFDSVIESGDFVGGGFEYWVEA